MTKKTETKKNKSKCNDITTANKLVWGTEEKYT